MEIRRRVRVVGGVSVMAGTVRRGRRWARRRGHYARLALVNMIIRVRGVS